MKTTEFCYWLQGFFELYDASGEPNRSLSPQQVQIIKNHLALTFKHDNDPQAGPPAYQNTLNQIHSGGHNPNELMRC